MRRLLTRPDSDEDVVIGTEDGLALARVPAHIHREMQYLWTRQLVHDGDAPRSIGVISQLSGEGVSFTSRALAVALARARHTCLIEANWWSEGLPLPAPSPGLSGLLEESATLDQVLVATNHPGLSIMPSGELPTAGRATALSSDAMSTVLAELQHRFDYVILDLPSLTTSTTALSFVAAAEAALLVVRQRVARIDQVESAIADLRHTNLLGVVLNANRVSTPKSLQRRFFHG